MGQGLNILASAHFGVPDVDGCLNVSPVVLFGVLDIAMISHVCHRQILLYFQ